MARTASLSNSFAKGVIDPRLSERIDLPHYYNSLESGLNIEQFPQGGFGRRPGTTQISGHRQRRRIQPLQLSAGMITAANGGTVANLLDQTNATDLTTSAVSGSTFVVAQIDLGEPVEVVFFDVIGFSCATGRFPRSIVVEYWDGAAWVAFGPAETARKTLTSSERTRRFGERPGIVREAQAWRIVVYGGAGAGAVSIGGIRMWQEKRQLSPADGYSFERAADLVYQFVQTDRNIDVHFEGAYVASIPLAIDGRQIASMTLAQQLDTMLLYHADVHTGEVVRQGANDEWNAAPAVFDNVPNLDPGTAFSGDQDEIQDVVIAGLVDGQSLVLWLEDVVTAEIVYDAATFAADVKTALVAAGVSSDITVTLLSVLDVSIRITFLGGAGGRRWPVVQAVVLDSDAIEAETHVVQRGVDADGPLMGETTGWPRCGVLYQERHMVAGFRSAPISWQLSIYGDAYDFTDDADPFTAELGFGATLASDRLETILSIFVADNILFFTETGEWWMEARVLEATQPPNVRLATRQGMKEGVQPVFAEGSSLVVQRGGRVVFDMVYSDVELKYKSDPLSLLAPHLLTNVVDVAHRPARSTDEGNQVFFVNADGTIAFMALLKSQEVVAMAPWQTDGAFRGVFTDVLARAWMIVERSTLVDGPDLYLEKLDGTHTLDGARIFDRGGLASRVIGGLEHWEGKEIWAWADRDLVGPMLVVDGAVTLPKAASYVVAGAFPAFRARLPRLRERLQDGKPWRPPARVYEVGLSLAGTGQIDLAVNGGPFRDVPLTFDAGRALDIAAEPPRDTTGVAASSPADALERVVRAVALIPGSGEFVYATTVITKTDGGVAVFENMHNTTDDADFLVGFGQAREALPNLVNVSLFVSWFGDDLRCGECTIRPKVDLTVAEGRSWAPYDWAVGGLERGAANIVSTIGGRAAYGGTPADRSVVEAIEAMRDQGQAVTLTPFLVMDIASGNSLPNPYGGASQPVYPWRGRITCTPAPGQGGTVDLTATAATQVAAFFGDADVADFSVNLEAKTVAYAGPDEWSYRRFILHYAHLALAAGGVDTFVIGSEMRGLTWVRSALGVYPAVTELVDLAEDVKALLGTDVKVVYAADWSELVAHQTGVPGEAFFHLDPLWSSPAIAAVGIDNYWPLADWRDGAGHLDYVAGHRSIYDRGYLQGNIAGGEGYDWYYASSGDRTAQVRSPITDGAYGKPWVWRFKDIKGWWSNQHFDRPAGVEEASPTAWVPQSKPIWFMETGCPAVDKGANQPNVFYDPKSSESFVPYFSAGVQDERMQRAFLEALIGYYTPGQTGFLDANNPVSSVTGDRMVDAGRIYVYCWDARFYPAFPRFSGVWGDGDLWTLGHWITGRVFLSREIDPDALPVGLGPELPMRDRLLTGTVRVTNLRGWSRHPSIEISQRMPAPLEVRAIRSEVAFRG